MSRYHTPSRDEQLADLRRQDPKAARWQWFYLVSLATALAAVAAAFFVVAALDDDAAFVGLGIFLVVPALVLGWLAWLGRSLARRDT